jgi:hypothetical protein
METGPNALATPEQLEKLLRDHPPPTRRRECYAEYLPWEVPRAYTKNPVYRRLVAYARWRCYERGFVAAGPSPADLRMLRLWLDEVMDVKTEEAPYGLIVYAFDRKRPPEEAFRLRPRTEEEWGRYVCRPDGRAV